MNALAKSLFLVALASCGFAHAQAWPTKPIRLVLPYPPGGPSEMIARQLAEPLRISLGQPIVIESKPGAGGNIGAAEVARSAPDGQTWALGVDTLATINPHIYKSLGFTLADLQPIAYVANFNQSLVCHPGLGVKTLAELVALAKTKPLNYASGGAGVPGHMTMEMLLHTAGITMTHIPYKGPAPAMQDVLGGQVHCGFLAGPTVLPHVRAGRLVALAVSSKGRSPTLPEVPSVAEAGYPLFDGTFSIALFAPRGVPEAITQKMLAALADALKGPELIQRFTAADMQPIISGPAEAAARVQTMAKRWGEVAKRINLQLD